MRSPTHLLNMTATITTVAHTGAEDGYGVPAEVTTTSAVRCWIHQTRRADDAGPVATQDQTWEAYFPAGTVFGGGDRVTVNGSAYEVDGPPWEATNPRTGRDVMVVATLRRTT